MQNDYGRQLTLLVAEAIQLHRKQQGLSLDDLAERAGMHRTSVGLIVRGRRGITIESAAALASVLGVELGDLVTKAERQLQRASPPQQ